MWQELNETNQAGSGDDFFQEKLLRTKVIMSPPFLFSFLFRVQRQTRSRKYTRFQKPLSVYWETF